MFRDDFFDDLHPSVFVAFLLLASLDRSKKRHALSFIFVVFRPDPLYVNILGVAGDPFTRLRGVDPAEDHWRRS